MPGKICVVGSINMDLVVRAPRFPRPGATVLGGVFETYPGGKGANQAVAASRMGAQVTLVGCLGGDDEGSRMRGVLAADGLDIHHVRTCPEARTGVAVITVVPGGENTIVVAPGANAALSPADVDAAAGAIQAANMLLLQGEITSEANQSAIEVARRAEVPVLLNAGPAENVSPDLLAGVGLLVVNRGEAATLLGLTEEVPATGLARRLAGLGPESVVVTLGEEGALYFDGTDLVTMEAFPVDPVDATGAGDAFVGALAVLRVEGARVRDALRAACAAGALATRIVGANPSLPPREQVEKLLAGSRS
ncbi:MAG: ribokinase [Planctomycetota bacterium]